MNGKVWMVGAGPGDPDLMTVRGREVLAAADVVVYDASVDADALDLAPEAAEVLFSDRDPLHGTATPELIRTLAQRTADGKTVVRLLGGDPFVFGPGVGEAVALAAAGVALEIVPGVTSTVAAPAYAGIPILHPNLARSYAVLTGDAASTAAESMVAWEKVASAADTLVFANAAGNLATLSDLLIRGGRAPQTPVAVVSWGTHTRHATVVGTLADIAELTEAAGVPRPAITVVGEVVRLRDALRWYDDRPLFGRRILLARTRRGTSDIKRALQSEGAYVVELPTQDLVDVVKPEIIERVSDGLTDGQYGWVIFASRRAVELFFRQLTAQGRDARAFHATRIVATGPGTVDALLTHGLIADVQATEPTPLAILAALRGRELNRRRVLLPRAEEGNQDLLRGLRAAGAEVEELPLAVANVAHGPGRDALRTVALDDLDAIVFPAAAAVTNVVRMLDGDTAALGHLVVACLGPLTEQTALRAGLRVDAVADPVTPAGMARALGRAFAARPTPHPSRVGG